MPPPSLPSYIHHLSEPLINLIAYYLHSNDDSKAGLADVRDFCKLRLIHNRFSAVSRPRVYAVNEYALFRNCAKHGDMSMLDRVFKLLKEESLVAGAISARDFQAFTLASLNGHIEIVRQIHKWWNVENYLRSSTSSAIPSLQLLEAKKFRCFSAACYGGHLPLARKLFNYAIITPEDNDDTFHHTAFVVDKRLDMVTGQGTFTPLLLATQQGHLATIQQIFSMLQDITTTSSYSQIILDMIRYEEFIIFRTAVSKGFLEISKEFVKVLQSLSSSSSSASILQEMISAKDYIAFISAASNGHLQLVEMLYASWSSSNETQTAMLSAQGYAAFYESSQNGHVGVVEKMLGWASDAKKEEIIKGEDFLIFRLAAQSGHVAMMRLFHHAYKWKVWPLDVLNHHHDHRPQLDLIQSSNFFALREASRNGFYDVVDILFSQEWASTSTIQTAMLQADGFYFEKACSFGLKKQILNSLAETEYKCVMDMCRVEDNPECLDAMEALQEWTRGTTHFSGIIKNEKFLAFRTAAASGRLDLMRILYSWCGTLPGIQTKREMQLLQLEMIKSETAQAFSAATEQGHFEVVKQLYLWGRTAKNSNLVQPSDFFYKYIEVEAEFLDGIDSDGVFVSIDSEIFANQLGSLLDIDKSTTAAGDKDVEEQEIG